MKQRWRRTNAPSTTSTGRSRVKPRTEAGSATLEFTLADETSTGTDIIVTRSTGFPDVDDAALRIIGGEQLRTHCAGRRFSKTITFWAEEPPKPGVSGFIHSSVTSD